MSNTDIPYHQICQILGDLYINSQSEKSDLYYKIEEFTSEISSLRSENKKLKEKLGLSEEKESCVTPETNGLPGFVPGMLNSNE